MKLLLGTWVLLILGSTQVNADLLRWEWTAGDVYEITLRSTADIAVTAGENKLRFKNEIIVTGQWTVVEFKSGGAASLEWQVRRVQINPNAEEGQLRVDTEVVAKTQEQKTLQAMLRGLLMKRFQLSVSDTARLGQIKEVRQDSVVSEGLSVDKPVSGSEVKVPQIFDSEGVARAFKHVFIQFPVDAIEVGAIWKLPNAPEKIREATAYKFLGSNPQGPEISFTSDIRFEDGSGAEVEVKKQQLEGNVFFNTVEHFIEKVVVRLEIETITDDDGQQIHVLHKESNVIELKKLLR